MDVSRRPPGELTVVGFALLILGGLAVTEGARNGRDALTIVGAFAFASLLVGMVAPILAVRTIRVRVSSPSDAMVGDDVELTVEVTGRAGEIALRVLDPSSAWHRSPVPGTGRILHRAGQRGVFHYLAIELRSSAPLGVFVRRRVEVVELDRPVFVAPRPRRVPVRAVPAGPATAAEPGRAPADPGDAVRSTRPLRSGDPLRHVHWPSSARRGELVVREFDPTVTAAVALVVDCRDPEWAEAAAAVAGGVGRDLIAGGADVVLCGAGRDGPLRAPVRTPRDLDRALAALTEGTPATAPDGWAVIDAAVLARTGAAAAADAAAGPAVVPA